MTPNKAVKALNDCLKGHGYKVSSFDRRKTTLKTSEEVESRLQDWKDAIGWIARQSGIVVNDIKPGELGHVISGELAHENKSLHITRLADGWAITVLQEGLGDACLMDVVKHTTLKHGNAIYHRFWTLPDDGEATITAWRFAGFEDSSS